VNGGGRSRLPGRVLDRAAGARRIADDEGEANPANPPNGERGVLTPDDTETLTAADSPRDDASSGNGAASPARRLAPGAQVERYEIIGFIGAGGMGEVYRARDPKLGREVAIKMLATGGEGEQAFRRLATEARAAGALNHPNVLQVYDVGIHQQSPYIVSELLQGQTLRDELRRAPLSMETAVDYGMQLAAGLSAAQAKGIVHRDLKPENLFITTGGRLKILDFGIAKLDTSTAAEGGTQTGTVIGTKGYMSPEQVRGEAVDRRSDIFSFGAILYEMLSGQRAFGAQAPVESAYAILHDQPPALSGHSDDLQRIIRTCLEKDPSRRFASAEEISAQLAGAMTSLPRRRRNGRRTLLLAGATLAAIAGLLAWLVWRPTARGPTASIAVLPFVNLSRDPDQEIFADGLSEELLDLFAKIPGLHVVARTSAFSFKGKDADVRTIGEKLHVSTILEGSVRKAGDQVRITTQLVNGRDGYQLWSETYDRKLADVFAVQDEIARAVVETLKVRLLPSQVPTSKSHRTSDPEVYAQYLIGRHHLGQARHDDYLRAAGSFRAALARAPSFAPAWAGLATAHFWIADSADTPAEVASGQRQAIEAAEKAVQLDPDLAEAYAARGLVRSAIQFDWKSAEADLERALALDGDDSETIALYSAAVLRPQGRLKEAIAATRKATELDPLNGRAWNDLGGLLVCARQFSAARDALNRSLELNPEQMFAARWLGDLALFEGRPGETLDWYQRSTAPYSRLIGISLAQHSLGHARESQAALDELVAKYGHNAAFQIAAIHAWRGENTLALEWLERARLQHDAGLRWLAIAPFFNAMRTDPGLKGFLRKMKMPD
jgi:TolB-like protein/tetratricopeptide (TPR) repeat protein/tRNA A-37 threonylcarbamoyl transferase component Bud32